VKICPVCKKPGYICKRWAKNRKYVYYYFKHRENGKTKWCYLGKTTGEKPIEEIINSIKKEVYSKAGTIKYKCECGKITEYLDLILTGGKCPKCGMILVKFSGCPA